MLDPESSRFWRAALESGLVDPAHLRVCWDTIPEDKRTADAADRRLARAAVNAGHVTVWQAQQLLTGRVGGFRIDRYLLVDLLGQGGMGRVYLAEDTRLGRQVALKVLSKERMNNPRALVRFSREAKVGAQLQHENLVRIYDEGEAGGIRYLVMEFIEGKNVGQLIAEQGAIPWPAAARLARQVALGLDHARLKGLIHRDVNPCNILVTHDGTAKLTDLGLAIDLADAANVTRDGATVGTFDYISPEQAKHSRSVDTRSDIYSLGCSLYHMIAGRVPFPMPSLPEKLYAHQLHDPDPLGSLAPDVPGGLAKVVRTMMRKLPGERYQTPMAAALALEPFVDEGARIDPTTPPLHPGAGPASRTAVVAARPFEGIEPASPLSGRAPAPALASDPDLAILAVDTGPEDSLGASSYRPRPKTRSSTGGGGEEAPRSRRRRAAVAAGLIGLLVVGVGLAVAARGRSAKTADVVVRPEAAKPPAVKIPVTTTPAKVRPPAIAVVSRDGTRAAPTLAEAVAIAQGNGGDVVLNGPEPVRVSIAEEIRVTRGRVTIRSAEGAGVVVAVDASGPKSLLLISAGGSVTIRGLRVVSLHAAQASPPPLIRAGGPLMLERSTFVASGATANSRLVLVEGLKLAIDGCLIEGFDRAIDGEAFPGLDLSVRRSMIVRAASEGPPGWAVRLRYAGPRGSDAGPGTRPRRLTIDRATVKGGGLVELIGFEAAHPLAVDIGHSAVQARALLAWSPGPDEPQANWAKALKWAGKANRYDITGDPWIVLTGDGELPMPGAPADLKGWSDAVDSDKDSAARSFGFASGASPSDPPTPADFALVGEEIDGVGADPKSVGPAAPPP